MKQRALERGRLGWTVGILGGVFVLIGFAAEGGFAVESEAASPTVERTHYGTTPEGRDVYLFTFRNGKGLEASVMTLGATLTTVKFPDRDGTSEVITLHKDSFQGYLDGHPLFGSIVGRFANRIAGARFTLNGTEHSLTANVGRHHIHGGEKGFQWQVWEGGAVRRGDAAGVRLQLTSPDGEAGYPGTLNVVVTYLITTENELVMDYRAETDKTTHVNLTNHAYWNLEGAGDGNVHGHRLELNAGFYLPADEDLIPTGAISPVEGTPLDFTDPRSIGSRLEDVKSQRYDHCYVLRKKERGALSLAARVFAPESGRRMEVYTTQPGVQFYTGNPQGLCLETQHFPDSPNVAHFPSTVLRPGEPFHQKTIHRFGIGPSAEDAS